MVYFAFFDVPLDQRDHFTIHFRMTWSSESKLPISAPGYPVRRNA